MSLKLSIIFIVFAALIIIKPTEVMSYPWNESNCMASCGEFLKASPFHSARLKDTNCVIACALEQQINLLEIIIRNQEINHKKLDAIKDSTDSIF